MIKWNFVLMTVLFSSLLLFSAGCQVVPATLSDGRPNSTFRAGELVVLQENAYEDVYRATIAAIDARGLFVTDRRKNSEAAVIRARDREDRHITIKLKGVRPVVTSVKIRYGRVGSLGRSQELFYGIDQELKYRRSTSNGRL